MSHRGLAALSLLALACAAACVQPRPTATAVSLRVADCVRLGATVPELLSAFVEQHPSIQASLTEPTSKRCLEAVRAGEADVALVPSLGEAQGVGGLAAPIARDGLAIIVHSENPVTGLGLLQLADLFGGRAEVWSSLTGSGGGVRVQPVVREEGSGLRELFDSLVMQDGRLTPRAVVALSETAALEYVEAHREAIGYVAMSQVEGAVKILPIEGQLPAPATLSQGGYALTFEWWSVTREPAPPAAEEFVEFALGLEGQDLIGRRLGRVR